MVPAERSTAQRPLLQPYALLLATQEMSQEHCGTGWIAQNAQVRLNRTSGAVDRSAWDLGRHGRDLCRVQRAVRYSTLALLTGAERPTALRPVFNDMNPVG